MSGDFELTMDELRVVARFVAESAQDVLPVFEEAVPGDSRPRTALDAAWGGPANAARIGELQAGDDPAVGDMLIEQARGRATPVLVDVLSRYPLAPAGKSRAAQLMSALDASLRAR